MIEKQELDITEVNLAQIADDYINHIETKENIQSEELADFLVIAAKLLYIKSKALLPYLKVDEEDDESEIDLERQLRLYKEFFEASKIIQKILEQKNFSFIPVSNSSRQITELEAKFSPPHKVNALLLSVEFKRLLQELEQRLDSLLPEERLEPKINIEDKIKNIKKLLADKIKVSFSNILESATSRTELLVNFLAVLELAKQQELIFEQNELFGEIYLLNSK